MHPERAVSLIWTARVEPSEPGNRDSQRPLGRGIRTSYGV